MRRSLIVAGALVAAAAGITFGTQHAAAAGTVIYDSTTTPLPGNLVSYAYEADQVGQFGDEITFTPGLERVLQSVTVTMSSWGCQTGGWSTDDCSTTPGATFSLPITLNLYSPPTAEGTPVTSPFATVTQTFNIPFRPSKDDTNCKQDNGSPSGEWYDATDKSCYNGLANNITFDLSTMGVTAPDTIVWGVVFNTSDYGPSPYGASPACHATAAGCGYDSLNVALSSAIATGSKPFPNTAYQDSKYGPNFCDNGADGTGSFRLDSPNEPNTGNDACWTDTGSPTGTPEIPAAQFTAITLNTPLPEAPGSAALVLGGLGVVPVAAWLRRRRERSGEPSTEA